MMITLQKIDNKRTFQRNLTHFIFVMNVRNNNYGKYSSL